MQSETGSAHMLSESVDKGRIDQSGQSNYVDPILAMGPNSLSATIPGECSAQVQLAQSLDRRTWVFPNVDAMVDLLDATTCFVQFLHENEASDRALLLLFRNRLEDLFDEEPVEDCMDHPAQEEMQRAFETTDHSLILNGLFEFVSSDTEPCFAAYVLRCLSRLDLKGYSEWRAKFVATALTSDFLETRDAGVRAAESWADPELRMLLLEHDEPVEWLRDYMADVIDDLDT